MWTNEKFNKNIEIIKSEPNSGAEELNDCIKNAAESIHSRLDTTEDRIRGRG